MGNNLKNIRESKGISQTEMANKLGMTVAHYNKVENGTFGKRLTLQNAVRAAEILNCTLDDIFFEEKLVKLNKKGEE